MLEGLSLEGFGALKEQPPDDVEFLTADGVMVKQMLIKRAFTLVPQHSHCHDHLSMLAAGSVKVWADGKLMGEFTAPCGIQIKRGVKHGFLSLEDNTVVYCVHNMHGAAEVAVQVRNDMFMRGV